MVKTKPLPKITTEKTLFVHMNRVVKKFFPYVDMYRIESPISQGMPDILVVDRISGLVRMIEMKIVPNKLSVNQEVMFKKSCSYNGHVAEFNSFFVISFDKRKNEECFCLSYLEDDTMEFSKHYFKDLRSCFAEIVGD